jgi:hypothetical protein
MVGLLGEGSLVHCQWVQALQGSLGAQIVPRLRQGLVTEVFGRAGRGARGDSLFSPARLLVSLVCSFVSLLPAHHSRGTLSQELPRADGDSAPHESLLILH